MTAPDARPEETPVYTVDDLCAATGMSERTVRRFFRALGFPDAGAEVSYSEADLAVLQTLAEAVAGARVDLATTVRLVRAVGQNVARMSDWQVAAIVSRADELSHHDRDADRAADRDGADRLPGARHEAAVRLSAAIEPALRTVLTHSWRRHLTAALARLDVDPDRDEDATSASVTVGFADLVNFSALSNELDSNRLGELVEIFESRCGDVVTAHDGRMIKTLGDSVLFVADDAERALSIAYGIVEVIGGDSRLPDVRLGLASGMVVVRMGDVFGPPVNLAARLTALARRNRVITDDATAAALRSTEYETLRLTARPLRGFGLVEPVAVRRR